ncbi:uncharacterized protein EI90DRAFT_3150232 [Cantharellus anzutake]|uniref:uncharacterized protein n=1 Tax=Cantharellus anzutake TaxID=1750568 RepID=UPI001907D236|nr:uncharacterized protein EI90DRAFT_3158301 [Cantharellus anzutake]XP_038922766.1 uncharacterized protein EI90DRAFT_3150232 [Cantharellus anzutake]KAF8319583.1 hypothetical protein EI90DRAFT_3158301 [Cantharellus anzutake]KAF8342127.1 hypothetical protein EI90DRAFT_3150232 [Cantharellus anzutake]
MSPPRGRVTVVGAGVIGLTCALRLAENGFNVDIIARDLPSDEDSQQFASPWAGANWHSFPTGEDERQCRWETHAYKKIWSLIPSGVAMKLDAEEYFRSETPPPPLWSKDLTPNYREMFPNELPPGVTHGIAYTTWSIDAPKYIKWLQSRLESLGVNLTRATIQSIEEPFLHPYTDKGLASIVVNATGLGARTLRGVEDEAAFPIRGQTVLIWAPHYKKTLSTNWEGNVSYIIPRPGGQVILGGTYGKDDWNVSSSQSDTERIVKDCLALDPFLAHTHSSNSISPPDPASIPIVKVNVGLRPARKGGARLELETIQVPLQPQPFKPRGNNLNEFAASREVNIIHAYGIGPAGFQASWGIAEDVLKLAEECASGCQ